MLQGMHPGSRCFAQCPVRCPVFQTPSTIESRYVQVGSSARHSLSESQRQPVLACLVSGSRESAGQSAGPFKLGYLLCQVLGGSCQPMNRSAFFTLKTKKPSWMAPFTVRCNQSLLLHQDRRTPARFRNFFIERWHCTSSMRRFERCLCEHASFYHMP